MTGLPLAAVHKAIDSRLIRPRSARSGATVRRLLTKEQLIYLQLFHVNYLGLSGQPDWELAECITEDEFTFITNNRVDFIRLFGNMELHAGLIVIVPNVVPTLRRALSEAAIQYLAGRELINSVMEVILEGKRVKCVEYYLPSD